jgi:hypothetical protein
MGSGLPSGQVAPGVAGFAPQQQAAMDAITQYTMGPRPQAMMSAAEQAMLGGETVPGILPYAQGVMGVGLVQQTYHQLRVDMQVCFRLTKPNTQDCLQVMSMKHSLVMWLMPIEEKQWVSYKKRCYQE